MNTTCQQNLQTSAIECWWSLWKPSQCFSSFTCHILYVEALRNIWLNFSLLNCHPWDGWGWFFSITYRVSIWKCKESLKKISHYNLQPRMYPDDCGLLFLVLMGLNGIACNDFAQRILLKGELAPLSKSFPLNRFNLTIHY